MTAGNIKKLLKNALINNGEMRDELYKYELEEIVDELKDSLLRDQDEYIFAVTENNNDVAMVLIEKSGKTHINEDARERLRSLWENAYAQNIKRLLPDFSKQLHAGEIPVNGVKTVY